ncbi:hypothetical protein OIT41_02555 [Arthrobacter sp. YA7-1]|uniref:hypothetical protein n=1 Tax=Arthrobacter sp. YA7-1 TaxID=2987701 RepID=UPI0022273170|nr:hypothetical protein [Arthrobacter sp. YA7-1]UYY81977.1 hypothetical protein OIT41_02555 [Arthrobacter sp. YA7-1]
MSGQEIDSERLLFLRDQVGLIHSEQYPDIAADLLVDGHDSPALRELAGHPRNDPQGTRDLWFQVRDELGKPFEDDGTARRTVVRHWLQQIVDGILDPYTGANLILGLAWFALGQPAVLNPLVADRDFWEELPERRDKIQRDLLDDARIILASW